jgi:hypothetical protein
MRVQTTFDQPDARIEAAFNVDYGWLVIAEGDIEFCFFFEDPKAMKEFAADLTEDAKAWEESMEEKNAPDDPNQEDSDREEVPEGSG